MDVPSRRPAPDARTESPSERVADPVRQRQVATMAVRRQLTVPEIERIIERGAWARLRLRRHAPLSRWTSQTSKGSSPSRVAALGHNLAQRATNSFPSASLPILSAVRAAPVGWRHSQRIARRAPCSN